MLGTATNLCSRHNHCFLKWHCVAGKTFFYCYTGDTLLKQISTFRANNSNVSSKDIPIIPWRICTTNLLLKARLLAQMNPGRAFIQRCQVCKQPNANLANLHPIIAYDKAQIC